MIVEMIRLVQNIQCSTNRKSFDDRAVKNLSQCLLAKGADRFHNNFCQQKSQGSAGVLANCLFYLSHITCTFLSRPEGLFFIVLYVVYCVAMSFNSR
jgi:hypothetical protein